MPPDGSEVAPTGETVDKVPSLIMINPKGRQLSIYEGDVFNLRFRVDISTSTREVTIKIDDKVVQSATAGDIFVVPVSSQ